MVSAAPSENCAKAICDFATAFLPMGELVDEKKESERRKKEIEKLRFEIERGEKMLGNTRFVEKAPMELVEQEKIKLEKNRKMLQNLLGE